MSLGSALDAMLNLKRRPVTIMRPGSPDIIANIYISPSNYSRNLDGPSESIITGREFVISKQVLDSVSFPAPKRGDRLLDPELGTMVISDINEMFGLGTDILSYRVRTS
jgi:hypothetical protein